MTIKKIINKFESKGYKVSRDMNSSNVVVTPRVGYSKTFESYSAASRYYFE